MPGIRVSTLFFASLAALRTAALDPKSLDRGGPSRSVHVVTPGALRRGSEVRWTLGDRFPVLTSRSELARIGADGSFLAERRSGSFSRWVHRRVVYQEREGQCWLEDRILYSPPGGAIASWVDRQLVRDVLIDLVIMSHRAVARLHSTKSLSPEGSWEADAGTAFLDGPDWAEIVPLERRVGEVDDRAAAGQDL